MSALLGYSQTPASLVPNLLPLRLGVTQSAPIALIGPMEPIARYQDTGHQVFQMNGPLNNPVADRYIFAEYTERIPVGDSKKR